MLSAHLDLVGIRQLFDRLTCAYNELKAEDPNVRELRGKIGILQEELNSVRAGSRADERRVRSMETRIELYMARLGELGAGSS